MSIPGAAGPEQPDGAPAVPGAAANAVGKRRAAADVAWQIGARVFNLLLGVVVTVVLSRSLGAEGFGQWSTLFAVTMIAGYLGDFGVEPTAVRFAAQEPEDEPGWLGALLVVRTALALPATLAALVVCLVLAETDDMRAAAIPVALTVLIAAPAALRATFQLRVRNDVTNAVVTANSILWTLAAIVVVALDADGLVAFAVALLAAATLTNAVLVALALRAAKVDLQGFRRHGRRLLGVSVVVGTGSLLTLAYGKIDQLLVFHYAGARDAGLYGAAYGLLERAQFIPAVVMTTLTPIVAAAHPRDPERVRRAMQWGIELLTIAGLPALAFSLAGSEPLVEALYGEEFVEAADALPVLMASFVLVCFGYLVGHLSLVFDLQRPFVLFALAALVFNVAANVVLLPRYGFLAAAWITLATDVLIVALAARAVLRAAQLRPALGRIARTLVATALTTGVLLMAPENLFVLLVLTVVAYPTALIACRAVTRADADALRNVRER